MTARLPSPSSAGHQGGARKHLWNERGSEWKVLEVVQVRSVQVRSVQVEW